MDTENRTGLMLLNYESICRGMWSTRAIWMLRLPMISKENLYYQGVDYYSLEKNHKLCSKIKGRVVTFSRITSRVLGLFCSFQKHWKDLVHAQMSLCFVLKSSKFSVGFQRKIRSVLKRGVAVLDLFEIVNGRICYWGVTDHS